MMVLQALLVLLSTPGGQGLLLVGQSLFLKLLSALHVHISTQSIMTAEQIAEYNAILAALSSNPATKQILESNSPSPASPTIAPTA